MKSGRILTQPCWKKSVKQNKQKTNWTNFFFWIEIFHTYTLLYITFIFIYFLGWGIVAKII